MTPEPVACSWPAQPTYEEGGRCGVILLYLGVEWGLCTWPSHLLRSIRVACAKVRAEAPSGDSRGKNLVFPYDAGHEAPTQVSPEPSAASRRRIKANITLPGQKWYFRKTVSLLLNKDSATRENNHDFIL